MLERYLKPYLIGYVNEHYEDVDDQLVFAYDLSLIHISEPTRPR